MDVFREEVRLGDVRDRYGNRLKIHRPLEDTFFACLSFAQRCGNELREKIRHQLLCTFVERVTGAPCDDIFDWRCNATPSSFYVSERGMHEPSVRSFAKMVRMESAEAMQSTEFREQVLDFIDQNTVPGGVYGRFIFAYLYCEVFESDVVFYRPMGNEVDVEAEISLVGGHAQSVTHQRTRSRKRDLASRRMEAVTPRPAHRRRRQSSSSASDSSSTSVEGNWHVTYLLYDEPRGTFELMYIPAMLPGDDQDFPRRRRRQHYQLRTCYVDGERGRGRINAPPCNGRMAVMEPPGARGWRVHSYLMSPEELHPDRIYQINGTGCRGIPSERIPYNRTMYVYLLYREEAGQPMAVFATAVKGGFSPVTPLFSITSNDMDDRPADGVLVTVARGQASAEKHVRLETSARIMKHA